LGDDAALNNDDNRRLGGKGADGDGIGQAYTPREGLVNVSAGAFFAHKTLLGQLVLVSFERETEESVQHEGLSEDGASVTAIR
jgi:hypothetical protein